MGGASGEIWFFLLETKKTTFLLKFSKSSGSQGSPCPPSDVHGKAATKRSTKSETREAFFDVSGASNLEIGCSWMGGGMSPDDDSRRRRGGTKKRLRQIT